jgi:hypothetical protein
MIGNSSAGFQLFGNEFWPLLEPPALPSAPILRIGIAIFSAPRSHHGMDQFIKSISEQLSVSEEVVRKALKVILQFGQKQVAGTEYEKFIAKIPGAATLLAEPAEGESVSNSLGGLLGGLGSMLGGQTGEAAKAFAGLQAAGLPTAQIGPFLRAFVEKAREVAGPETVDEFLKKVPVLQGFLKS